jgi:hypothetical protein
MDRKRSALAAVGLGFALAIGSAVPLLAISTTPGATSPKVPVHFETGHQAPSVDIPPVGTVTAGSAPVLTGRNLVAEQNPPATPGSHSEGDPFP